MANKENQPPGIVRCAEQCTPPGSALRTLGLRPWQTTAFASPPFRATSPNSRPSLLQQRDHSACRHPDTPLKVRKTRENLRQDALYAEIPPPCLHLPHHPVNQDQSDLPCDDEIPAVTKGGGVRHTHGYSEACVSSLPSLPPFHPDDYHPLMSMPPPLSSHQAVATPPRMHRHRSVSRRMLSKVRQGIASRAKTTPTVRPTESETSLMRRISGRRKQSVEVERRAQSFEISRDSVATVMSDGSTDATASKDDLRRSVTQSTISTSEALGDAATEPDDLLEHDNTRSERLDDHVAVTELQEGSPLTPRPLHRSLPVSSAAPYDARIPFINMAVTLDRTAVDAGAEQQVWVALEASVEYRECTVSRWTVSERPGAAESQLGAITSLRLCFKPVDGCSIVELVGQRGLRNLTANQTCSLFIKVQVPKVSSVCTSYAEDDQASLFTELECMVGTLQTELLHLEARYRHSLLPYDNVVAVKHVANIKRPKLESRWSMIDARDDTYIAEQLHTKLAIHLADHHAPARALKLIDRHLAAELACEEPVRQVRATVAAEVEKGLEHEATMDSGNKPSVVITDIDIESGLASRLTTLDHQSTAPCTPVDSGVSDDSHPPPTAATTATAHDKIRSVSMTMLACRDHDATNSSQERGDAARKIWRHIRRSSLTARQLAELAPEQLQKLEMSDQALMEIRRRALANKRSVGAETLKAWQWDEKALEQRGEMPWM